MKKSIMKRMIQLLIVCLVVMGIQMMGSAAEKMPDLSKNLKGILSVKISCQDKNGTEQVFDNVTLQLYQVADLTVNDGAVEYTLKGAFAGSGVNLNGITASQSVQAAIVMADLAEKNGIKALTAVTDQNGKAVFKDLSHGMYLVAVKKDENTRSRNLLVDPYLVSVPLAEEAEGSYRWNYVVDSAPKSEISGNSENGKIIVTKKTSIQNGDDIMTFSMADAVFYFGLFKDADGTKPYADSFMKSVHLRNASAGTAVYENLPEGTYYVFETDSNGMPIRNGETVTTGMFPYICVVEGNGTQKVEFKPTWEVTEDRVVFNNVYPELPTGYYYEPEISITKRVLEGNREINTNETFYAGIFTKTDEGYALNQFVELKQNGTVKIPFYIQITENTPPVEYWIFETDEEGNRIDTDTFAYKIEGEGSVELSSEKTEASITLINRKVEEETEVEESEEESEAVPANAVRTGDDTPILPYVFAMCAAVMLFAAVLVGKRRKKEQE